MPQEHTPKLLETPPVEMKHRRFQSVIRHYPDGRPLLQSFVASFPWDKETRPVQLEAFDILGQEVFDFRAPVIEGSSGVEDVRILEEIDHQPTIVISRKIGENLTDVVGAVLFEELAKGQPGADDPIFDTRPQLSGIGTRQIPLYADSAAKIQELMAQEIDSEREKRGVGKVSIIEFAYDEMGRPIKKITSENITSQIVNPLEQMLIGLEEEEENYTYDEAGRLRSRTTFRLEGGQLVPNNATLFVYEDVNEHEVRVIEYSYSAMLHKDLSEGLFASRVHVTVYDKQTRAQTGFAIYEYEDHRKDEILNNYYRVKKYPHTMWFERRPPDPERRGQNVEQQPMYLKAPSYLSGADIYTFMQGAALDQVGTPGNQEKKLAVYYLDEFMGKLENTNVLDAVLMLPKVLDGEIVVNLSTNLNEQLNEFVPRIEALQTPQRVCIAFIVLRMLAAQVYRNYLSAEIIQKVMKNTVEPLVGLPLLVRQRFVTGLREVLPTPDESMERALWVLENLETFPALVKENPERFNQILD